MKSFKNNIKVYYQYRNCRFNLIHPELEWSENFLHFHLFFLKEFTHIFALFIFICPKWESNPRTSENKIKRRNLYITDMVNTILNNKYTKRIQQINVLKREFVRNKQ